VTSLNLDGQYIGKLTGLEKLGSLRWASFNGNCITKLDGLECCLALEELSLQDNCIYKLDGKDLYGYQCSISKNIFRASFRLLLVLS